MPAMSGVLESDSITGTALLIVGHKITLTAIHAINAVAATTFIQLFDKATAAEVTLATTIPRWVMSIAASSAATDIMPGDGIIFENGIVAASTTTNVGNTGAASHLRLAVL